MKKVVIFLLVVTSFMSFSQRRGDRATQEYRCQFATKFCGHNGGRFGVFIRATSHRHAENKCIRKAYQSNQVFCQVRATRRGRVVKRYRCQLTKGHCGHNGGRYGFYINARGFSEARNKCLDEADYRGDGFCQVQDGI